jgi:hypothetical protein
MKAKQTQSEQKASESKQKANAKQTEIKQKAIRKQTTITNRKQTSSNHKQKAISTYFRNLT